MKKQKIIVIGSGFGGLGSAIRLAAKGHDVTIFEKRDKLGGRAYQYEINGFKFDGGPTVITAPYIFDEIFEAAGRKRDDYFKLVPLNPFYRIFNHEGRHFDYYRDTVDTLAEIDKWNPADKTGYENFVKKTVSIFEKFHPYTDKPFLRLRDMLKIMPEIIRQQGLDPRIGFAQMDRGPDEGAGTVDVNTAYLPFRSKVEELRLDRLAGPPAHAAHSAHVGEEENRDGGVNGIENSFAKAAEPLRVCFLEMPRQPRVDDGSPQDLHFHRA